jgi:hypothetical protein
LTQIRQLAAYWQNAAARYEDIQESVAKVKELVDKVVLRHDDPRWEGLTEEQKSRYQSSPEGVELPDINQLDMPNYVPRMRLLADINAQRALAFAEFIAEGGKDSPQALEKWQNFEESLAPLMPTFDAEGDGLAEQ